MPLAIFQQIVARPMLWIILISMDVAGPLIFLMNPQKRWIYVVRLFLSLTAFAYLWLLDDDALITDIREIYLYDVLINCLALSLFVSGMPAIKIHLGLSGAVFFLKYGRLVWPCKTTDGKNFSAWPVFGALGFQARRANASRLDTEPTKTQAAWVYLLIIGCLLLGAALSFAGVKTQIAYFCIIPLLLAPSLYKRIQAEILAQHTRYVTAEKDKLAAEKAAAQSAAKADAERYIAEEKEKSNQLLAAKNAELEQANAEIQALLAEQAKDKALLEKFNHSLRDASHDLQHPMAVVRIHAEALTAMSEEEFWDKEKWRAVAQKLDIAIEEMTGMIETNLHSAQVVTGIIKPDVRVIDMDRLLKQFMELWLEGPNRRGLDHLLVYPSDHTGLYCPFDVMILKRILRNLIANAIQHTPPDKGILIALRHRGGRCVVEVRDSGAGIPEGLGKDKVANFAAFACRLREEGSRVKQSGDRSGNGSGYRLGMRNVLQLCEATGLTMQLCARPERGSKFSFSLPLASADQFIETIHIRNEIEAQWDEASALLEAYADLPMPEGDFFPEDDDLEYHNLIPNSPKGVSGTPG